MKERESSILTSEALEIFRQKTLHSVHILPACWGGYDKNDKLCQNCALATDSNGILVNIAEAAKRVNEDETFLAIRGYGGPFFAVHSGSCIRKRQELENAVRELEAANKVRKERRAIKNITRMPKGEVREGKAPFDYVKYYGNDGLWVRLNNGNDKFPKAIGVLYRYDGYETVPSHPEKHYFRADRIVGYISGIFKPTETDRFGLFEPGQDEEYFLVFPKRQMEGQGSLALEVARKRKDSQEDEVLLIALEPDSYQKVSARFDDIGQL